jgi:hypothetical protein
VAVPRRVLSLIALGLVAAGCGTTYDRVQNPMYQEPVTRAPTLAPTVRRAIDRTISAFVVDAVARHRPAAAFDLATPAMRAGQTRAEWAGGHLPVPPFDARGSSATQYSVLSASPRDAELRLLLQPKHPRRDGVIAYQVHVKRIEGRWLVDWFTPVAFFAAAGARPGITAEPDLAPQPAPHAVADARHASTVAWGLLALIGVPAIAVAVLLAGFAARGWSRRRRVVIDDGDWRQALRTSRDG